MDVTLPRKLWEHPRPQDTQMYHFMQKINKKHRQSIEVEVNPE